MLQARLVMDTGGKFLGRDLLTAPGTLSAFRVSFGTAALAALIDGCRSGCCWPGRWCGMIFPGRRVVDALIDLPLRAADIGGGRSR